MVIVILLCIPSEKSSISKLGSVWLKRWVTVDTDALKYYATNKVAGVILLSVCC